MCTANNRVHWYDFKLTLAGTGQVPPNLPHLGEWTWRVANFLEGGNNCARVFDFVASDFEECNDLDNIQSTKSTFVLINLDKNAVILTSTTTPLVSGSDP